MNTKLIPIILSALMFAALPALGDLAGTEAAVILDVPHTRTGVGAGTQTRGYTFKLDTPRTLTHLGMFLYNQTTGADVPRQIGVWDAEGNLVVEVTIPVGGGEIEDLGGGFNFTYLALDLPVILLPEVIYTVGIWYSENNSPGLSFDVPFTTIEGFTYLATAETGPPGGAFAQPTILRTDRLNGYIGPNLRFDLTIPSLSLFTLNEVSLDAASNMLTIKWDSAAGKIYDLLSSSDLALDPATWPVYGGLADLPTTPPENTVTFARPADPSRFFVVRERVAPPTVFFADDFEGADLWTSGSEGAVGTAWEFGSPSSGSAPTSAASGINCYGTNLAGDYAIDADVWLRSPAIDLTDPTLVSARLTFKQFKDIEATFDGGSIRVLDAATDLPLGTEVGSGFDGTTADWEEFSASLPAEALGKVIKIEFRFTSDNFNTSPQAGWYIDEVVVSGR